MHSFVMEAAGSPKLPKWKRTVLVDQGGTVYMAAGILDGDGALVLLNACWDDATIVVRSRHSYVPICYLIEACPQRMEAMRKIEATARQWVAAMH